jgi:diguanylate cyclase (GGDEF)-like protein
LSSTGRSSRLTARHRRKDRQARPSASHVRPDAARPTSSRAKTAPAGLRLQDLASRLTRDQRAFVARAADRQTLLDVVRATGASPLPADIAAAIIEHASTWWTVPVWAFLSFDDLSSRVTLRGSRGLEADTAPGLDRVAAWVMAQGTEFVSGRLAADARVSVALDGTVLAFPLVARGRRVGVLIAFDPRPSAREPKLTETTLASVHVLLEPVAAVLDSALLIERAEALSVTDDLTHLYNSRYLNQVLRRETKRAGRSGRPLSLLFIDLDGFKSINDTYGHVFGSRALVEAGAVIRGSARETDVPARFGGDEFALILPDTGEPGALAVAERVRERIAAHVFLRNERLAVHLTASVGVATLPDAATTADELVQAADAAMYLVKDRGKNGIHAARTR